MLNDITEHRQMKRFLLSLMMAACLVGNIAAQEQLDSLSYAMGDYSTRIVLDSKDEKTKQITSDREGFIRGYSDGVSLFRQERAAAGSYYEGQQMGLFFLMSINWESHEDDDQPPLDCLIKGLRKVADNTVVLPGDTIGAHQLLFDLDDEAMLSMVDGDSCRIMTTAGILFGLRDYHLFRQTDRDQGDSITVEEQQAFAAGMADILERSATPMTAYDMGQWTAAFFFPEVMRMKPLTGLVLDYDAIIDGARGALELTERKMNEKEVEMCLTKYYMTLYDVQAAQSPQLDNGDDIDDPALEEALKEAFKKAEEETATQHSDEEN